MAVFELFILQNNKLFYFVQTKTKKYRIFTQISLLFNQQFSIFAN